MTPPQPTKRRQSLEPAVSHTEEEMLAFGAELAQCLAVRGVSQTQLAELIGTTQSSVSTWVNGKSAPFVKTVFRVEELLSLPAGHLSQRLGFLPANSRALPSTDVEQAALVDPLLDELGRRVVLSLYRELVSARRRKR